MLFGALYVLGVRDMLRVRVEELKLEIGPNCYTKDLDFFFGSNKSNRVLVSGA